MLLRTRTNSPKPSVRNWEAGISLARRASSSARKGSSMPSVVIGNVPKCMPTLSDASRSSVRLHRFRRIHVHGLHEPARLVRADGQQCQIDRAKPHSDVAEEGRVGRVAGEEYARAACHEHEPAPEGSVSIERISCGEVLRRRQRDRQCGGLRFLPPIELLDAPNTA